MADFMEIDEDGTEGINDSLRHILEVFTTINSDSEDLKTEDIQMTLDVIGESVYEMEKSIKWIRYSLEVMKIRTQNKNPRERNRKRNRKRREKPNYVKPTPDNQIPTIGKPLINRDSVVDYMVVIALLFSCFLIYYIVRKW